MSTHNINERLPKNGHFGPGAQAQQNLPNHMCNMKDSDQPVTSNSLIRSSVEEIRWVFGDN